MFRLAAIGCERRTRKIQSDDREQRVRMGEETEGEYCDFGIFAVFKMGESLLLDTRSDSAPVVFTVHPNMIRVSVPKETNANTNNKIKTSKQRERTKGRKKKDSIA